MKKRRDPFETSKSAPSVVTPASIHDALRVASARKRNRQWERKHQNQKVVYRGVDPKLALKVKSIAGDLLVPGGEVARALIEYSLCAYVQDDLNLNPRPNPNHMRMTLLPSLAFDTSHKLNPSKYKRREYLWRVITTWRGFPSELKKELAALSSQDELNVPIGELITALLRFGLKAYDAGLLNLRPVQKDPTCTLTLDGTE